MGCRNLSRVLLLVWALSCGSARAGDLVQESPDGPEHVKVYLTLEQALDKVFARADSTWTESWTPTPEEIADLEMKLGWRVPETEFVFYRGQRKGQDLGVAMVTEEKGRFKPITFMVKLTPAKEVEMVHVMVYRESRGDGVKRQRFLKQFRGRDAGDPMRMNREITNLSGATLSSRAITAGVKRVLAVVGMRYGHGD
jgi:thiamine biosynthesis lipoprotein